MGRWFMNLNLLTIQGEASLGWLSSFEFDCVTDCYIILFFACLVIQICCFESNTIYFQLGITGYDTEFVF